MLRQLRSRSAFFKPAPSRLVAAWESTRPYSIKVESASTIKLQEIDPSKLSVMKTTTPKELVPPKELVFGRTFTGRASTLAPSVLTADYYRSYAQSRMDCLSRMASPTHHPLPKPLSRPRQLRLPLRIRMFRRNESIQG